MKKVYCAGPFEFEYKDYSIENLGKDYRAILVGNPNNISHENPDVPVTFKDNLRVEYTGPFYFYEDQKTANDIVESEMNKVLHADIVLFYLPNNATCPGTVTELIYASTLANTAIVLAYEKQSNTGEPENEIDSPLWYPLLFASFKCDNMILKAVNNKEEAIEFFREYLTNIK